MNDEKLINVIKALSIAQITKAGNGHPGIALGAAPILYTLYTKHLNIDVLDDKWINRDRFILSAGHASSLLYATLYMSGFDLSIKDLKEFRKIDSKTPGHPEFNTTPGVEMTTGPLGQGFAAAVGISSASKYLSNKFNGIIDYKTYVLCSEGDLMEGISYEAASLAGNLKLNNLIVLFDSNKVTLDGPLKKTFSEDILKRFEALGWYTDVVADGNNVMLIDAAIEKAKRQKEKPSFIEIKTVIGKDSLLQGSNKVHGGALTKEDVRQLREKLKIDEDLFSNIKDLRKEMVNYIRVRTNYDKKKWQVKYNAYIKSCDEETKEFLDSLSADKKFDVIKLFKDYEMDDDELRNINGKVMNVIADNFPSFIGGSCDVSSSTKTYLNNFSDFSSDDYGGKNIWFGVREHASGAFVNGLALGGLSPFMSTFLAFSDYLKPAIRMASLMDLPSTFIFTHDSLMIGSDGPTHEPIEQLASLRSIPNFYVYRPCDYNEIVGSWNIILNNDKPSALIISKNKCENLDVTNSSEVKKGAYIVKKENRKLYLILIATGSEVKTALDIAEKFESKKIGTRVISMPCMELFEKQPKSYKEEILPIGYKTFVIERLSGFGWNRYVYNDDYIIGINSFGQSGDAIDVLKKNKLDDESIYKKIEKMIK